MANKKDKYGLIPEGYKGSSTSVGVFTDDQESIRQQMNQNSIDWWNADDAGKAALAEANRKLAAQLGSGVTFNSAQGTWGGSADKPVSAQPSVNVSMPSFDYDDYLDKNPRPSFDYDDFLAENPRPSFSLEDFNAVNIKPSFSYEDFLANNQKPSFSTEDYMAANPKPVYESQYSDRIDALLNQILNREKFSYNVETDPLYQQYKTMYNREGARALNDTMASAAGHAGGMNSYAMVAAQQANDYYNAQLNDKIPELYQLAYSMYMNDVDSQRSDLSMLQGLENADYGKHLDRVSDWRNDRDFAYGQYRDQMGDWQNGLNFAYGQYRDQMGDYRDDLNFAYDQHRDQVGDWQNDLDFAYGIHRDEVGDWYNDFNNAYGQHRDSVADSQWEESFNYQKEQDALAQKNYENEFAYQKEQDALARQDALNKLLNSGGNGGSSTGKATDLETIYSMGNEAEVYDYLVSKGMSNSEAENYMAYWKQHRNDLAYEDYVNGPSAAPGDTQSNYKEIDSELRSLVREGYDMGEVVRRLEDAYDMDLLTEEEYLNLKQKYQA